MNPHRPKKRRNSNKHRGFKLINGEVARPQSFKAETSLDNGSFVVKRKVAEPEVFEPVLDAVKDIALDGMQRLSVSIVDWVDGSKIMRSLEENGEDFDLVQTKRIVRAVANGVMRVKIGRPVLVGARERQEGRRYLAFTLDTESNQEIQTERSEIISNIAPHNEPRTRMPHISIACTRSQEVALAAWEAAKSASNLPSTITLEPAEAFRVQNKVFK